MEMHGKLSWLASQGLKFTKLNLIQAKSTIHKHLCQLMCAHLTYFQVLAANHLPNISLERKKIGQHVVAGALEAVCKFCIFPQKFNDTQAPIKDVLQGPFGTRTACLPRGKLELKEKIAFPHIINTNSVLRGEILGRNKAGGRSGGGRRKGGRGRDARGHVVTCTFPFRLRSGTSR